MPVLLSYRSQSLDLQCKSINWFLYEGNTGTEWVKQPVRNNSFSEDFALSTKRMIRK